MSNEQELRVELGRARAMTLAIPHQHCGRETHPKCLCTRCQAVARIEGCIALLPAAPAPPSEPQRAEPECPDCEKSTSIVQIQSRHPRHKIMVPVWHCNDCGLEWTDHVAEDLIDSRKPEPPSAAPTTDGKEGSND